MDGQCGSYQEHFGKGLVRDLLSYRHYIMIAGPLRSCSREVAGDGAQFSTARPHKEAILTSTGVSYLHKRQAASIIDSETAAPGKGTLFPVTDQRIISIVDFQPTPPPGRHRVDRKDERLVLGLADFQLGGQ